MKVSFKRLITIWAYIIGLMIVSKISTVSAQRTFFDKFINEYRSFRGGIFKFVGRSDTEAAYLWNVKRQKVQKSYSQTVSFPCNPNGPGARSNVTPISAHTVRPGDIDIVGAIGDSLTAGNGAFATNILQVFIENKGVSWSIGGQGDWRKFLTLPNILKEFNKNLYGYSTQDGFSIDKSARFNVAEIGAMSRDIPYEARILVKRMRSDQNVDVQRHWKLVTILIGPNDFCSDFCYLPYPEKSVENHRRELIETLRILRDNLPRTIVNLVTPPSMKVIYQLRGKPKECVSSNHFECPCIFGFKYGHLRQLYFNIITKWQAVTAEVPDLEEFTNKDDFAVINQPFLRHVRFPHVSNGNHDFKYMSVDCFHLSQKGYAIAANSLWNNMFEPYGNKSTNWKKEFTEFKCPTAEHPYIFTRKNS
ncbi:phospholipase B1, membrane-associated [Contarinia nasturtii]|uniref:phospholipase B1, membrane-associated n=1 Tax=Contarinia nasturtii TaxID=265458 RepID=UPI0012D43193|nr:phospholipase B1, membrane-associated [Contarinia nasturtii]XP_031640386.1 phospholipase B1, membrane-associated [Contarinia nasturtii]XP_031640387.1 phospholipase B1, membrane-associated [Contarinia nasturtii]XP_031640388.1 phospholipase B1, membrane-associated [Contarinia nasturtii]XP_031640390.1 phospholipase B1, membrane-associated [Contarinia nasturtii]XP_031640391.1 phospholipase B1, membrane-associated [Contarinia nasturtii]XP_031640392.1 phospholipase B1, membrane-associated [Conta